MLSIYDPYLFIIIGLWCDHNNVENASIIIMFMIRYRCSCTIADHHLDYYCYVYSITLIMSDYLRPFTAIPITISTLMAFVFLVSQMNFYRFSIAWSRLLPNGDISHVNPAGVDYYNRLINKLIDNGIEPMATMYHYDLPQPFAKFGGLSNEILVDHFVEYADLLFNLFGDRVKRWMTFNEPLEFCIKGYGKATQPPLIHGEWSW